MLKSRLIYSKNIDETPERNIIGGTMKEEFINKIQKGEYISNHIYDYILTNDKNIIPQDFNIDKYNEEALNKLYKENREYFDNMYKGIDDKIHLDEEQCKAILADEKYSLIIAGAGTGKTTTMISKTKYLVEKKNVDPKKILLISYTRKTTEELSKLIEEYFGLPVNITTFHSLGYRYIKEIFKNNKCVIMDRNKQNEILLNYFKRIYKNKRNIKEILENFDEVKEKEKFIFSKYFLENYIEYDTYDDFVDAYIKTKIEEAKEIGIDTLINNWIKRQLINDTNITTLNGEYVKSAGELIIANFLYINGIDYKYEEVYDELMENKKIYKPDFTLDYGGEKIYIEYFGLDNKEYNKIKNWKINFHKSKENKFINIERLPLNKIIEELNLELLKMGIKYKKRTSEEIYEHILRLNPLSQVFPILNFLYECLISKKESVHREEKERVRDYLDNCKDEDIERLKIQHKYITDFEKFYGNCCFGGEIFYFDFADLLYYSNKYIEKITKDNLLFEYIIIDEYQDISQLKYELTYKTATKNAAKVYAVGDDWQSIYGFNGSRIEYIYKFKEYFKGAKSFNISKTYRNSQELIDCSGEFIMKNENQIKKELVSDKHLNNPVELREFSNTSNDLGEINCLKQTILEIHKENPEHKILILARYNKTLEKILKDEDLVDDIGTKILFKGYEDIQIDGMSMHKSKGLTYDEVIVIGLNKYFPSYKTNNYWYTKLFQNEIFHEPIPFAEERRLFYVALTRTKNKVYLLCDSNEKYRSDFIKEIEEIIYKN